MRKIYLLLAIFFIGLNKTGAQSKVTVYTTKGSFEIELTDTLTPITVDSFLARTSEGFYDGLLFHRVINNFMIQGGDPNGNGTGGPGYTIPDEFHPTLKNVAGALAMANLGQANPNSGGCQFFINLVNNNGLNNIHTVFGKVTTGFTVVQEIGKVPVDANNNHKPLTDVKMDSIKITHLYTSSINRLPNAIKTSVYPNPSRGNFNIDLPATITKIEIVNMRGQIVYHNEAKGKLEIDFRNQPKGLYMIRLANEQGKAEAKVIVQ